MSRDLDALTSSTLKHLREHWWDDAFTAFLEETLQPRPGKRILDVGCGTGTAEISLARLRLSQMQLFGVDLVTDRVRDAHAATRGINARVGYAAADACRLPFAADSFDSTYCVAVLQHIRDLSGALGEIARVTRPGGRVLIVEPDNAARYWFSSVPSGMEAFELGRRFFGGLLSVRGESPAAAVGPLVPGLLAAAGVEPVSVRLFPVSVSQLGVLQPLRSGSRAVPRARGHRQGARRGPPTAGRGFPQGHRPVRPGRLGRRLDVRRDSEHDALRDGRTARRVSPVPRDRATALSRRGREARAAALGGGVPSAVREDDAVAERALTTNVQSGSDGWDAYAPFYDWENAQTVARRDIAFWRGWRSPTMDPCSSWAAARDVSRFRSSRPVRGSSASIYPRRCSRARASA